jgi:hypothetical protein
MALRHLCALLAAWVPLGLFPAASGTSSAPTSTQDGAAFDHSHAAWTKVLQAHVKADRFDYAALAKDPAGLKDYMKALRAVTPAQVKSWGREQRFAFWINAYNAHTILKVVDNLPLKSIRDLDGAFGLKSVFDDEFIAMKAFHPDGADDKLSLNDIENGILRKEFEDARLHAAINCASFSCPALLNEAFTAEKLDEQLTARMRGFLADLKRNVFVREKGQLKLSEIFKWFRADFERDAGSVGEFLARYVAESDADFVRKAEIRYVDYDWSLNGVEPVK